MEPEHSEGWLLLGALRHQAGDLADAVAALSRGLELHPGDVRALSLRGSARLRLGVDPRLALRDIETAVDAAVAQQLQLVGADGAPGAAAGAGLQEAVLMDLVDAAELCSQERVTHKEVRESFSGTDLPPIVTGDWGSPAPAGGHGEVEAGCSAAEHALAVLERATVLPGHLGALALSLRGRVRAGLGDVAAARGDVEQARAVAPGCANVLLVGGLLGRKSDPGAALEALQEAAALDPRNARAQLALGRVSLSLSGRGAGDAFALARAHGVGALRRNAALAAAWVRLHRAGGDASEQRAALEDIQGAARLGGEGAPDVGGLVGHAAAASAAGESRAALRSLCRAVHLAPGDVVLLARRALMLQQLGRREAALEDWWRALAQKLSAGDGSGGPSGADARQLALIQMRLGRADAAARLVQGLRAPGAGDDAGGDAGGDAAERAALTALLGRALWLSGDVAGARASLDDAVAEDFGGLDQRAARGELLAALGARTAAAAGGGEAGGRAAREADDAALADLDWVLREAPPQHAQVSAWLEARALLYRRQGRVPEAYRDVERLLGREPGLLRARMLLGMLLEGEGAAGEALGAYDAVVAALDAPPARAPRPSALQELAESRAEEARELRALRLEVHMRRGALHARARPPRYERAIEDYNAAVAAGAGRQPQVWLARGMAFHAHGYLSSAAEDYARGLAVDPRQHAARRNRAVAHSSLGDHAAAVADLTAIPRARRDARDWCALAQALRALGRPGEAEQALESAVECEAGARGPPAALETLLLRADLREERVPLSSGAWRLYALARRMYPGSALACLKLALAAAKRGRAAEAQRLLAGAVGDASTGGRGMHDEMAAMLLMGAGQAVQAGVVVEALLQRCCPTPADRAVLLCWRGVLSERAGDFPAARRDWQRALREMPALHEARYNLGCVLLREGAWVPAAAALDEYLAAVPRSPAALLNRGVARARLGRAAEALADTEAALALQPKCAPNPNLPALPPLNPPPVFP